MAIVTEIGINGGPYDSTKVVDTVNGFPVGDKAIDASFIASMIACFVTNGVLDTGSDDLKVSPGDGLSVKVNPGTTWANGYMSRLDNETTLELAPGHTYLVLVRQNNNRSNSSLILYADNTGWIPVQNENLYDMILAEVKVPEGASAVASDMITDKRGDSYLCGYVTSKLRGA